MARPRAIARTRSSIDLAHPGQERIDLLRAWRSAIDRYGTAWQRGESLRPQPWQRPASQLDCSHETTRIYRAAERPSLSAADQLLAASGMAMGSEPSYDRGSLARVVGPGYEPQRCIGIGGMAEVWLARQVTLHRPVAIKVLPPGVCSSAQAQAFRAEALISSHLSHPNILPVYDAGENFIVMKFVEGHSMAELMADDDDDGMARLPRLIEALIKVCDAIAFAHERGVVHCDLKPQNVMLGRWGEALVMDWGLAFCTSAVHDEQLRSMVGRDGRRCAGTPGYLSPEMARRAAVDQRSDVFLLGAMLYEMLVGEPPFDAGSALASVVRSVDCAYTPVQERSPGAPRRLIDLQERAMAMDADARMSAKAFGDGLREWMGSSRNEIAARGAFEEASSLIDAVRSLSPRRDWDQLYAVYRRALGLLEQALTLVPDHVDAKALHGEAMAAFKVAAVSAGELFLARLIAGGQLPPQAAAP